jgi:alcohol dehydrogenase YqhD (iron-dependent ADH family)
MTTRLADGNIGNDDGVKLANIIPPLLNWITSDNTDKHKQYINLHINVREYRKGNTKIDNPEKYKQYINLHIFPSTLKDHSLSQKMNDDINIDSIITLSRKQVFNGLLVKKGTSVGL